MNRYGYKLAVGAEDKDNEVRSMSEVSEGRKLWFTPEMMLLVQPGHCKTPTDRIKKLVELKLSRGPVSPLLQGMCKYRTSLYLLGRKSRRYPNCSCPQNSKLPANFTKLPKLITAGGDCTGWFDGETCNISRWNSINFYCSQEYRDTRIAFLSFANDAKKRSAKLWMRRSAQKKMCLESQACSMTTFWSKMLIERPLKVKQIRSKTLR